MDTKLALSRAWVEVDCDALLHNYHAACNLAGSGTEVAAVLKANAYGHGAVETARILKEAGCNKMMVACLAEALELRREFSDLSILVMGYTADNAIELAIQQQIRLTIFSLHQAKLISSMAVKMGTIARVHIKIDTGFHRLGMELGEKTIEDVVEMAGLSNLALEGLFTHLALTDSVQDDAQVARFNHLSATLKVRGVSFAYYHICDSIGLVRYPEYQLDLVRIGAFLYGVRPFHWEDAAVTLLPTMTFKTRIAQIRELPAGEGIGYDALFVTSRTSRIGTLTVGYADGYPRCLSGKAQVALHGKRAPVVGLLCMDQAMVDLTDIPMAREGDEVVLLGGQGENAIPYLEYAKWANTNRNEAICALTRRVPRVYKKNGQITSIVDEITGGIML